MVFAPAVMMGLFLAQAPVDMAPWPRPVAPAPAAGGARTAQGPQAAPSPPAAKPDEKPTDPTELDTQVVTRHRITIAGKPLKYTATAGMMPLKAATGEVDARVFYTAYTLDSPAGSEGVHRCRKSIRRWCLPYSQQDFKEAQQMGL